MTWDPHKTPPDIGLVIALSEEFRVLQALLGTPEPIENTEFGADDFKLELPVEGGRPYRCIATLIGGMDTDRAAHATNRLMTWKPGMLINVGIAASLDHGDLRLADVLVADQVDRYATMGKVSDAGDGWSLSWAGAAQSTTSEYVRLVEQLEFSRPEAFEAWQAQGLADAGAMGLSDESLAWLTTTKRAMHPRPKVIAGHLASGPFVQASPHYCVQLHRRDRKLIAAEMEAGGMLLAAHDRKQPVPTLVLRGVSDLANTTDPELGKKKLDALGEGLLRRLAMANAIRLLKLLAASGRLPRRGWTDEPPSDFDDPLTREELELYRRKALAMHRAISLLGFPHLHDRLDLHLEDLYVDLEVSLDRTHGADIHSSIHMLDKHERGFEHVELSLATGFAHPKIRSKRGFVLLGDAGSGKTTHLKQVLLKILRDGPTSLGLPEGTLPVFLPLQALTKLDAGLPGFIQAQLHDPKLALPADFGKRLCRRSRVLYLFDGLDEVSDLDLRARITRWIEDIHHSGDDHVIVSCRIAGYTRKIALDAQFLDLKLRPLDAARVREFVCRWYRLVERERSLMDDDEQALARAKQQADKLIATLESPRFAAQRLQEMTGNPLLLTAICLIQHDHDELPDARAKLYEATVSVLLERWRQRQTSGSGQLGPDDVRDILQAVAVWMHAEKGRKQSREHELVEPVERALAELQQPQVEARRFLTSIRNEAGLLTGLDDEVYAFLHLGLQEYLTASAFHQSRDLDFLVERFADDWWQEVILLMLGIRRPCLFEEFMTRLVRRREFAAPVAAWADSEMMALCFHDAAVTTPGPFLAVVQDPSADEAHQLAALRVLARVQPASLEGLATELRVHPRSGVRAWWGAREGSGVVSRVDELTGVEFVRIEGGTYWMGSPENAGNDDERPLHRVMLAPFELARTAVTNEQYRRYLDAKPGAPTPRYWSDRRFNQPNQPVVGVAWDQAMAYCAWAGLELPTEAQWEVACRAGSDSDYSSGTGRAALDRVGWCRENSEGRLHAVAEKEPNAFGLYDMHGNVWEWCSDGWVGNYQTQPRPGDGLRREPVVGGSRVIRGGGWGYSAPRARSTCRDRSLPGFRSYNLGFRPAQVIT